jgi:ppGpp synthetase/RelA/SpoT-type nucleotidyltranferase
MLHEATLVEYARHRSALDAERLSLERLLRELLTRKGIQTQLVTSRVKATPSLRRKLARPDRTYRSLWDVTDLIGLRIAVYFEDELEPVARAIEAELPVDLSHSQDKLRVTEGEFGYRSLHYVCALPHESMLPKQMRFEIQVRTVLQHAWAEVEHDLGYKANDEVPETIRRRFSRIASLLEIADEEFVAIRKELSAYGRDVDVERPFPLDAISLLSVAKSPLVVELDGQLAQSLGKPLEEAVFFPDYLVPMLKRAGLRTTREVMHSLETHRAAVQAVVGPYFEFAKDTWALTASNLESIQRGYCLFFLAHVALLKGGELEVSKVAKLTELYRELDYPDDEKTAQKVASGLLAALRPHIP